MRELTNRFRETAVFRLYRSFSPASRAAILLTIPFTLVDAIHYYTAGTALVVSFPLVILVYLVCGITAGRMATRDDPTADKLFRVGGMAAFRLWLTSTVINVLISVLLGFVTVGATVVATTAYLCLSAPLHAMASWVIGGTGGWLHQEIRERTRPDDFVE